MASAASILLQITGSDQVSGMLKSVSDKLNGLKSVGASVGSGSGLAGLGTKLKGALLPAALVGSAVAGVKAYVGQLKQLSAEYSNLSGRAKDAGTSASSLLKLAGAANQFNLKGASVEMLADSFAKMTKNAGVSGVVGFASVLKAVANLNTEQERATRLAEIFGKTGGVAFLPLVNGGEQAISEFFSVADSVTTVRDSTVAKFADIGTALEKASESMHSTWSEAMLGVVQSVETALGLTTENTAETVANVVKYIHAGIEAIVKVIIAIPTTVFRVGRIIGEFLRNLFVGLYDGIKGIFNGDGFKDAFMDSMRQFVEEAGHELQSIKAQWGGVVDLQALKAGETEGKSLTETMRDAIPTLGSKLGASTGASLDKAASKAGKTLHDSLNFAESVEIGTNAFTVALAKAQKVRGGGVGGVGGSGSPGSGGGVGSVGGGASITQNSILAVLRDILTEARRMSGNLNFATV